MFVLQSRFEDIEPYLVYDVKTKIIYYKFIELTHKTSNITEFGYFGPYISENGKFCRYIDGEIVEING